MNKILVTTVPFCEQDKSSIDLLNKANIKYVINPYNRKITEDELCELIPQFDGLIAGTEKISRKVMQGAKKLKIISRVGVGLDGIDLLYARSQKISVSYTPEAPVLAVADLTIGLMMSTLRNIHLSNLQMHRNLWNRHYGKRIQDVTVGVIGVGRIGSRVINFLRALGVKKILAYDVKPNNEFLAAHDVTLVALSGLYAKADVITLHVPLNESTRNMITIAELLSMKQDAILINTARGGVICEKDLLDALNRGHFASVAVDVFEKEPYLGQLSKIDRCLLTSHMGSMSYDCRARMEIEATQEIIRYFSGEPLRSLVPDSEYN